MKTFISALALMSSFSAFAVGHQLSCKEIVEGKRSASKPTYSIKIKDVQDITRQHPEGRKYDAVYKTRVQLTEKIGTRVNVQNFDAVSFNEDVMYFVKANNFRFNTFFDELDQTTLVFLKNGKRVSVDMDCN